MSAETGSGCVVIRGEAPFRGKQQLEYVPGVTSQSVGSRHLSMLLVTIPPGASAPPHLHRDHETAIYILRGESEVRYGDDLAQHLVARTGDFLYIPPNTPHQPANRSQTEPCVAVLARTDSNEQESVVLLSDLFADRTPVAASPNEN